MAGEEAIVLGLGFLIFFFYNFSTGLEAFDDFSRKVVVVFSAGFRLIAHIIAWTLLTVVVDIARNLQYNSVAYTGTQKLLLPLIPIFVTISGILWIFYTIWIFWFFFKSTTQAAEQFYPGKRGPR